MVGAVGLEPTDVPHISEGSNSRIGAHPDSRRWAGGAEKRADGEDGLEIDTGRLPEDRRSGRAL